MRRLISVGLVVALLLAPVPVALGLLHGLSRGHSVAASSGLTCSVKPSCDAGEVAVFRMSGLTNAHAGTAGGSAYANVVCCSGPTDLSTSCAVPHTTVLRLWAADNAHAAEPSDTRYTTEVCLSATSTGITCQYGSSCSAGYACLATIFGTTNAHVADCVSTGDYATKVCCAPLVGGADTDGDGCTDSQEISMGFNPNAWYDFYDVPIPANNDPTPNGTRNKTVNLQDVVGVLKYVGTSDGGGSNGRVAYDSTKDGDWNGDTVVTEEGDEVGLRYDRSPGPLPNPPYDAGPPDGTVNLQDVVVVLKQVGLSCAGPPTPTPTPVG